MARMGAIPNVWFRALGQYRLMAHVVSDLGSTQLHDVVPVCSGRDRAQAGIGEPFQAKTPPVSFEHRPSSTRRRCATLSSGEKTPMAVGPGPKGRVKPDVTVPGCTPATIASGRLLATLIASVRRI